MSHLSELREGVERAPRGFNPVLAKVPRGERRFLLKQEAARRQSGDWGAWERLDTRSAVTDLPSRVGWLREVVAAHRCRCFSVLERPLPEGILHLAISSLSGIRPTWPEAQRIKNEIAGPAATAVEVYPPQGEVVDGADMYHLWVLPGPLPFSLHSPLRVLEQKEQDGNG